MGKVTAGSPRERRLQAPCPGIGADGMVGGTRVYPQRQIKADTYIHHARRRLDGSDLDGWHTRHGRDRAG